MNLRRTAVPAAVLFAATAAVVPSPSASAGAAQQEAAQQEAARREWVCLVTAARDRELTLRLPSVVVDRVVEHTRSYRGPCAEYGQRAELGDGELIAYSQAVGPRPVPVGLIMTDGSLDGLPHDPPTDGAWCFDKDGNGTVDPVTECTGGYERQLGLGAKFQREVDSPYTYVLANWNPHGHIPAGVYDRPHFDVHFYVNQDAERTAIRPGRCPQLVHCDDYALGSRCPTRPTSRRTSPTSTPSNREWATI